MDQDGLRSVLEKILNESKTVKADTIVQQLSFIQG